MNKAWWKPKTLLSDRWIPEITLKNGKLMSWFLQPRKVTVDLCKSCMTRIRIKDYIPLSPKNFFNWFCGRSLSHMWKKQVSSVQWSQPLCQSVLLVDEEGIRKQVLLKKSGQTSSDTWVWNRSIIGFGLHKTTIMFCWRKKPRTSCYGNYPMIYKLLSISIGSLCISSLKSNAILTLKFRNLKGFPSLLTYPQEVVGSSVSERTNHGPSPMGLTTRWLNGSWNCCGCLQQGKYLLKGVNIKCKFQPTRFLFMDCLKKMNIVDRFAGSHIIYVTFLWQLWSIGDAYCTTHLPVTVEKGD